MDSNWIVVFTSGQLHLAEMAKELLKENGIESAVIDKRDSLYITIGEVELLVRNHDVMNAKFILDKNKL